MVEVRVTESYLYNDPLTLVPYTTQEDVASEDDSLRPVMKYTGPESHHTATTFVHVPAMLVKETTFQFTAAEEPREVESAIHT